MSVDAMSLERLNLPEVREVPDTEAYYAPARSLDEELSEENPDNGEANDLDAENSGDQSNSGRKLDERNPEGERDLRSAHDSQESDVEREAGSDPDPGEEHVSELDQPDEAGVTKAQKLAAFENMQTEYAANPVAFMQRLLAGLSQEQAAALGVAATPEPQEVDYLAKYPHLTEQEGIIEAHREHIVNLPEYQEGVQKWQNQAADVITAHAHHLTDVLYENARLTSELAAIKDALGVKLPAADRKAIEAEVRKGKSYTEAFASLHTPEAVKAAKVAQAAARPVPKTPLDASAAPTARPDKNASMYDIFKGVEKEYRAKKRAA